MPVRKAILVTLAMALTLLSWGGFLYARALTRIRRASEEVDQGLARLKGPSGLAIPMRVRNLRETIALSPKGLSQLITWADEGFTAESLHRCVSVGFHLRRPPLGVFRDPPARPIRELLAELEAVRLLARRGGLDLALLRIVEERAFVARVSSMIGRDLAAPSEITELRAALAQQEAIREPLEDAFEVERLLLMREVLSLVQPDPSESSVLTVGPGWRDLGSWTLLRARALEAILAHFERVRCVAALSNHIRSAAIQAEFDAIEKTPSLIAPGVLALEYHALYYEDAYEASISKFR